jgi:hypothetical protein
MTDLVPEGGIRPHRIEWILEESNGVIPDDPEWNQVSPKINEYEWTPDSNKEGDDGLGDADAQEHHQGPEAHDLTLDYDLYQAFKDSNGNYQDLSAVGMERVEADQTLTGSVALVAREETTDKRQYVVAKGGSHESIEIPGETGNAQPIKPNMNIAFEKVRKYTIWQPKTGSQNLVVQADDDADDTQTLRIENEGNTTGEDVSLDGTTMVTTNNDYGDVDAIELDAEAEDKVHVYINDGTTASPTKGMKVTTIPGKAQYRNVGDLGVPALGSGSHASGIGGDPIYFHGSTITLASGDEFAKRTRSVGFTISNDIRREPKIDDIVQDVYVENRTAEMTFSAYGETEMKQKVREYLFGDEVSITWDLGEAGTIELQNAEMTDPPSEPKTPGEAVMMLDMTYEGKDVKISAP